MSDDNSDETESVIRFPKQPKPDTGDKTFFRPHEVERRQCYHKKFILDDTKARVECADCGEHLNPMWVIEQLALHEHRINAARKAMNEERKALEERARTKCDHCGRITSISRRRR